MFFKISHPKKYIKGPKDVFKAELFDSNSAIYNAVKEAAELENILDGKWTPSGEVYIYYSVGDEMVAPACSLKAEEMWKELPNVSFDKIGFLVGSDHRSAAIEYYIYLLAAIYDNYPEA